MKIIIKIIAIIIVSILFISCEDSYNRSMNYFDEIERKKEASIVSDTIVNIKQITNTKNESTIIIRQRNFYSENNQTNERYLEFFYKDSLNNIKYEKVQLSDVYLMINNNTKTPIYKHSNEYRYRPTIYINQSQINLSIDDDFVIDLN